MVRLELENFSIKDVSEANFNSLMVRLEFTTSRSFCNTRVFQFLNGAIGVPKNLIVWKKDLNFNSLMVRLE